MDKINLKVVVGLRVPQLSLLVRCCLQTRNKGVRTPPGQLRQW